MSSNPASVQVGGEASPINILIVDDEPANLTVLETVLDDPGYRLVRATSADEALLALVAQDFALLILDIRLPDMTGFELAQLVKERRRTASVPIIFLTAYYDKDQHALEGYGTGAVDFLTKPVNPAVLRSKVSVFADLQRGTQSLQLEVAERRKVEQQLIRLNETLEQRVVERSEALEQLLAAEQAARSEVERLARAKEEFLAMLSHELRTPLAAIVGWANILKSRRVDAETMRRGLDAITRNAEAQSHLVNDLLEMSRIASGKLRMAVERVDLNAVCAGAVETARPAAQNKGVRIEVRLTTDDALDVMGDPTRLQQVVSNLLNNALKFTPADGTVTVSTRLVDPHVEVTVADTGEGIAAAFLPQVFERFRQADGSAARVHGGLGLGLSIVDNLVQMHAGSVTAHSDGKGRGAVFTVRLPRADATTPARSTFDGEPSSPDGSADVDTQPDLHGISVLLVDDNADVLEVERRMLCDWGADVTAAGSAEQAIRSLQDRRFDLLLSDLSMPGKDGYALIREVRQRLLLDRAELPAIAITALVRDEDRRRALEAGYQACIHKPAETRQLARLVRDLSRDRAPLATFESGLPTPLRALLVEDDGDVREPFQWLLEEQGLDVLACASGEEAEAAFRRGKFQVVVTDVSMPGMSGFELARRLRADSPDTWIVFSTGHSLAADQVSAFGPRARSLRKPFEEADVRRLVDELRV